LLVFVNQP